MIRADQVVNVRRHGTVARANGTAPAAITFDRNGETAMKAKTVWETFKAEGENVVEQVKQIVHEGNVRRVVVKHEGRKVAEFPLTAGVVGAVLAPVLAAIGALVALMKDCTIAIERTPVAGSPKEVAVPEPVDEQC